MSFGMLTLKATLFAKLYRQRQLLSYEELRFQNLRIVDEIREDTSYVLSMEE